MRGRKGAERLSSPGTIAPWRAWEGQYHFLSQHYFVGPPHPEQPHFSFLFSQVPSRISPWHASAPPQCVEDVSTFKKFQKFHGIDMTETPKQKPKPTGPPMCKICEARHWGWQSHLKGKVAKRKKVTRAY